MKDELQKTEDRIRHCRELENIKYHDIKKTEDNLCSQKSQIVTHQQELKNLDSEICYYEEQNRKLADQQATQNKALEYEQTKHSSLKTTEAETVTRLHQSIQEVTTTERELNVMKCKNDEQCDLSNDRSREIEALNRHIQVLTSQNYQYSSELQSFLQTDDVVKTRLDRRHVVDEIRFKVDSAIRES